ncbi:MAG: GNAT family N-acetyltransferase [Verrucomicrobia bacterium]|jgi:ribosomal protein S18 acetylase RimI-like enzyme|nr:GNAT family N-acetyltransferase [Verrucomicrobiota bacterium]
MTRTKPTYSSGIATFSDVWEHLAECRESFTPSLSQRVDIREYSCKLHLNAETFEAWDGSRLIGLLAAYFNDPEGVAAFISSVSVSPDCGKRGIAASLMTMCIDFASSHGFKQIRLEVSAANIRAVNLYRRFRFQVNDEGCGLLSMTRDLKQEESHDDRT